MLHDEDERFLVSVQWGAGPHYFVTPKALIHHDALLIADEQIRRLKAYQPKRGALPKVRMLEIKVEVSIKREKAA
jgi:hypothetical protein